ncbi:metal ABC transporter solute-binding protein, Zn/Mn family [Planctomicrobium sp. SH668]|uniref:metal ABC transporter solute-binding protein, Zn/Mn family n=1 Tax=Planctomicrobium sp. SH668 TaxID=3448126 RepID=UPI003F5C5E10
MKKILCLQFLLVAFALILTGCEGAKPTGQPVSETGEGASTPKPLRVVVTTTMVGDLVRAVASQYAEVRELVGEGVDPHMYRPTTRDVGEMLDADVIFYSGLGLEGSMQTAFERVEKNGKRVAAVTQGLSPEQLIYPKDSTGHPDPHVWNDASLWAECLPEVVKVLSELAPVHAEEFAANADLYKKELLKLHTYAIDSIASIPAESRYLVTAHDAFSYFSRAYQIEERAVQGISTESEPGVQDINNLVDFLVAQKVPALFVEATVNAANLKAVIEGAKKKGHVVREGGVLYSDSTGSPGTYEASYIGMFDHNVTVISHALGGKVELKGLNGKLQ